MNRASVVWGPFGTGGLALLVASGASAHGPERPRPVQELFMPESWAGQWKFHVEHRDRETGTLISTEEATESICPGDRLGLSAYLGRRRSPGPHDDRDPDGLQAACTGVTTHGLLDVACSSRLTRGECRLDFRVAVHAERRRGSIGASGEWAVTAQAGDCDALLEGASLGETVQVSGVRLGGAPGACTAPPASLIEKLPIQPELVLFLPRPIGDLTARRDGRTVVLRWSPVPRASAYKVYRARPGAPFHLHAWRPAHDHDHDHDARFADHRARAGQAYRYVVRWVDGDGRESPVSNEVGAAASEEVIR